MPLVVSPLIVYSLLIGTIVAGVEFVFLFILGAKTPGLLFLKAGIKGNGVIYNPKSNNTSEFLRIDEMLGRLAKTKMGYFFTKPEDFYTERKSKTPIALAYSNYAVTINTKDAKATEMIRDEANIENHDQLQSFVKNSPEKTTKKFTIGKLPYKLKKKGGEYDEEE